MFSNEFTKSVDRTYKLSYHTLNGKLKKSADSKKYFIGSHDELGYYQPDLTDLITDAHARRGSFTPSPAAKKPYFEYWYSSEKMIKIKYLSGDDDYDVIPVYSEGETKYLFYSIDIEGTVSLMDFYILKYDENGRLILLDKYIRQGFYDKFDLARTEYFYTDSKLIKAVTCDGYRENSFDFEYDPKGNLIKAVLSDGRHRYEPDISGIPEKYRKFGMYHFG